MNQTLERLQEIEKNGYQIDFGNIFNHAFENYKKIALYAGSVIVIFSVLFIVFSAFSLLSVVGVTEMTKDLSSEQHKIERLIESNIEAMGIGSIIISCLLSPFQAAFLKMADHADRDENFPVSSLFSFYKLPYLKEIVIATLLISVVTFAQATLFRYIKFEFLGILINYFISFITLLTIPLIIFGNLQAMNAIKHSIQIVLKQPIVLLGLIVVAIIGSLIGFMACCVGLFFTIPFIYSMNYAIYSAIIGIDNTTENE
ncbi:DUF2189 domain-containing protein [Flavobacterium aquicola]|uniref:Beta-carotene 15,15'-monooxygenase n=1 Tax=Flavobacterium aquicola TaxID=1682742 RepID=A0A3E0ERP3_9FLAO|nr:hypothetical protein [Flavobacterium aquicola]REH00898.1 hypothetical protein C8P67_102150 [Flavobacterium aquicola]